MRDISEVAQGVVPEMLNFMNAGIYVVDSDRKIVFWNRVAEELTGYTAAQAVGKRCLDNLLMHRDKEGNLLCKSERCPLYQSMKKDAPSEAPVLVYAKTASGETLPVSTAVAPVHDSEGNVIGGVEVFRDERENIVQMELARAVHRQMLTADPPDNELISFDSCYVPVDIIGGDFYHAVPVGEDVFTVFLADVAGHGTSAALYVALMHSLVRECSDLLKYPDAFMTAASDRLCDRVPEVGFVTAAAATFDAATRQVHYCSAGHPPALVQPGGGDPIRTLECINYPLGVEKGAHFNTVDFTMAAGDRFLVYTDGVTELRVGEEQWLGLDGLVSVLSEHPPEGDEHHLERVFEALIERSATPVPEDDVTLLSCMML